MDSTEIEAGARGARVGGVPVHSVRLPGLLAHQEVLAQTTTEAQKAALLNTAIFPVIMLISYILLTIYFRSRGGYGAEVLHIADEVTAPTP